MNKQKRDKFKNLKKRCTLTGRCVSNKEVVLTEYAVDYVKKQGYIVQKAVYTIILMLLCMLTIQTVSAQFSIQNDNYPILLPELNNTQTIIIINDSINGTDFIRRDGTTTTTASIPFAQGISIPDGEEVEFVGSLLVGHNNANLGFNTAIFGVDNTVGFFNIDNFVFGQRNTICDGMFQSAIFGYDGILCDDFTLLITYPNVIINGSLNAEGTVCDSVGCIGDTNLTLLNDTYIKLDGTSNTTALIPFEDGLSTYNNVFFGQPPYSQTLSPVMFFDSDVTVLEIAGGEFEGSSNNILIHTREGTTDGNGGLISIIGASATNNGGDIYIESGTGGVSNGTIGLNPQGGIVEVDGSLNATGKICDSVGCIANVSNLPDYIRKDGTTTTTATIPFSQGGTFGMNSDGVSVNFGDTDTGFTAFGGGEIVGIIQGNDLYNLNVNGIQFILPAAFNSDITQTLRHDGNGNVKQILDVQSTNSKVAALTMSINGVESARVFLDRAVGSVFGTQNDYIIQNDINGRSVVIATASNSGTDAIRIKINDTETVFNNNITLNGLFKLQALNLPSCSGITNGSIGRNMTDNKPYYCDGIIWNGLY